MNRRQESERNRRAIENPTALSAAVTVTVDNPETYDMVRHAFRKFASFCEAKDAPITAAEMRAIAETKHDWRMGPPVIRLNRVGMVVATGFALVGFANFLAECGARKQAEELAAVYDQMVKHIPDDWDCGDPDCEACAKHHGRVRQAIRL